MFSFLFKRSSKTIATPSQKEKAEQDPHHLQTEQKALTLAHAEKLANESDAAEFILQCSFADARLQAAQQIYSRELLEKVLQAMRNTDRRVARLMQQRLEILTRKERNESEAKVLVEKAGMLAEQSCLLPNQLSEIDLAWEKLEDTPEQLAKDFETSRAILQKRLDEQTKLQRSVIETRNRIRQITEMLSLSEPADLQANAEMLGQLKGEVEVHRQAAEAASLPKNLLIDLAQELSQAENMLAKARHRIKAIAAYEEAYANWESQPAESLDIDMVRRASNALPELAETDKAAFGQRLSRLTDRILAARRTIKKNALPSEDKDLLNALSQLEQLLEDGALQTAIELEKVLRLSDLKAAGWSNAQISRFTKARNELLRLQGWARWGGQVSREELIRAAEALPAQEIMPAELAKKVGSLRSFWKSMDATSGPSSKELWLRFDAACAIAYTPAAEHFQRLSEERKHNLEKAYAMISEVEAFAAAECKADDQGCIDWRKISGYRGRMLQAWRELAPIDRKEKKQADTKFAQAIRMLSEPLAAQQQLEIQRREKIIGEVEMLDPADRHALESIRMLQQRWQQYAKALPLERKDEQSLWQRFRSGCDKFFEQRKAIMQQSETVEQTNLQLKQKICETLESSFDISENAIKDLVQQAALQWSEIGRVPRGAERNIQRRYQDAVSALNSRLADQRRSVRREQFSRICTKLAVCRLAEERVGKCSNEVEAEINRLQSEWNKAPPLPKEWQSKLSRRFEAALTAIRDSSKEYASMLQNNRIALERNLLLLEILLEAESPIELSGERLKLQVEVLQSCLKSGGDSLTPLEVLSSILETPALGNEANSRRADSLIRQIAETADIPD